MKMNKKYYKKWMLENGLSESDVAYLLYNYRNILVTSFNVIQYLEDNEFDKSMLESMLSGKEE